MREPRPAACEPVRLSDGTAGLALTRGGRITEQDHATVEAFKAFLITKREAKEAGRTLCFLEHPRFEGMPCTHDRGHDGTCTWADDASKETDPQ